MVILSKLTSPPMVNVLLPLVPERIKFFPAPEIPFAKLILPDEAVRVGLTAKFTTSL